MTEISLFRELKKEPLSESDPKDLDCVRGASAENTKNDPPRSAIFVDLGGFFGKEGLLSALEQACLV